MPLEQQADREAVSGGVRAAAEEADRQRVAAVDAGHERGRLGRVATSCEMFGLDKDDLRARFAPYVSRFLA